MTPKPRHPAPDEGQPSGFGSKIPDTKADKIWQSAIELFEGQESLARDWMNTEAIALGWRKPIEVMVNNPTLVMDHITRVSYGVYT